jgi:hypothetical protein
VDEGEKGEDGMKATLSFKTPDAVDCATEGLEEGEAEEVRRACKKWVEYGECLTVEVDTEAGTCVVLPAGR